MIAAPRPFAETKEWDGDEVLDARFWGKARELHEVDAELAAFLDRPLPRWDSLGLEGRIEFFERAAHIDAVEEQAA